jgi:hypothetical protein
VKRGIGGPSLVEDFRKPIVEPREQERDLKSVEVLRRMRLAGQEGQRTALFALIATVRPNDQTPLVRFEGLPGEFSQHDFGHVDVEYVDGAIDRIRFFAPRLKYSRTIRSRWSPMKPRRRRLHLRSQNLDPLDRRLVEQMLVGVATRQNARSLELVGPEMASRETSKSGINQEGLFTSSPGRRR